ncbi:hypothetical protein GQX74_003379 [Glossina fuscipes]|nr:hypothetical protein GQX74_003379 [Glossina fuscipes]
MHGELPQAIRAKNTSISIVISKLIELRPFSTNIDLVSVKAKVSVHTSATKWLQGNHQVICTFAIELETYTQKKSRHEGERVKEKGLPNLRLYAVSTARANRHNTGIAVSWDIYNSLSCHAHALAVHVPSSSHHSSDGLFSRHNLGVVRLG